MGETKKQKDETIIIYSRSIRNMHLTLNVPSAAPCAPESIAGRSRKVVVLLAHGTESEELNTLVTLKSSLYPVFYFYTINDSEMNMILIFMVLPYENIVHIRHVFAVYSSTKK